MSDKAESLECKVKPGETHPVSKLSIEEIANDMAVHEKYYKRFAGPYQPRFDQDQNSADFFPISYGEMW